MKKLKSLMGKFVTSVVAMTLIVSSMATAAFATGHEDLNAGTYEVEASLTCFVQAMGGVEFGAPLLTGTTVVVNEDGTADMTLSFTTDSMTIYGVACENFIDADAGQIGYFDGSTWKDASYTKSSNTIANSAGEAVHYVDTMTFRLPSASDTYDLSLYINSNVMGVQFGGADAKYNATLTVNWDSAKEIGPPAETVPPTESSSQSSKVELVVEGGYEVEIPATITVDASTKKGNYTVVAKNFVIPEKAYVTVTASKSGALVNGKDSLSFTNTLENKKLQATGDELSGTVEVTTSPSNPGKYAGTIDFTINYYSGN
ncbi:hypothetical protein ACPWSR_03310 [Alloiococcus sp. CFN-8]|uniref:hypothetical protein n=1 Tax=Alloiococcus sp. CFN-8 TaxID=3416081 RepID=UPI003CEE58EE